MKDIFKPKSSDRTKEVIDTSIEIEMLEVLDSHRKGYKEREISAIIVTMDNRVIEIAQVKTGIAITTFTPYTSQQAIKGSLLDAIRYLHTIAGKSFIVVQNDLYMGEQLIDLSEVPHTIPPTDKLMWNGVKWVAQTNN